MQRVLDMAVPAPPANPYIYGPIGLHYDDETNDIVVSEQFGEFRTLIRCATDDAVAGGMPRIPERPAWSCSPSVNAITQYLLGAGKRLSYLGGRSMTKACATPSKKGGVLEYVEKAHRKSLVPWRWILEHQDDLGLVNIVFMKFPWKKGCSHVILALRCGEGLLDVTDPKTGERCDGLWRLSADGYFRNTKRKGTDGRRRKAREFSCKPMAFRPFDCGRKVKIRVFKMVDPIEDGGPPDVPNGAYGIRPLCGMRAIHEPDDPGVVTVQDPPLVGWVNRFFAMLGRAVDTDDRA